MDMALLAMEKPVSQPQDMAWLPHQLGWVLDKQVMCWSECLL
jgi:hypothetical protein